MLQNSRKMNRINRALSTGSIAIGRSYWTLAQWRSGCPTYGAKNRAATPSNHPATNTKPSRDSVPTRYVGQCERWRKQRSRSIAHAIERESVRKNDPVTVLSLHQEAPSLKSYIWKSPYGPMETPLTQSTGKIDSDKPSLLRATYMLSLARPHTRSPDHFYRPATRRRCWSETEWSLTFRRIHPHHP